MFNVGQKISIKSSGTVGVVRSVADNGDIVIQTINGTYGYTKANANKYLSCDLSNKREPLELKTGDIVMHNVRAVYGVVGEVTQQAVEVIWHLGGGRLTNYKHGSDTKVLSLFMPKEGYDKYYHDYTLAGLCVFLGVPFDPCKKKYEIFSEYLGNLSSRFGTEGAFGDVESVAKGCDCLTRETVEIKNVINRRTLKDYQREQGPAQGALSFRGRCVGKTTGIALSTIGDAMQAPGYSFSFSDHHATRGAQENLYLAICNLIDKLGLKGFDVDKKESKVTFHPFVEVRTTYEAKTIITPVK